MTALLNINIKTNFEYPLDKAQKIVSDQIYASISDTSIPKLIQIIAQPQAGKTNTILDACALIDKSYKLSSKAEPVEVVYFGPADNELCLQVKNRFANFEYESLGQTSYLKLMNDTVYHPQNISGDLGKNLINKINKRRRLGLPIIFIHDESHRDIGENNQLPNFFRDNNIFLSPIDKEKYISENENKCNEVYISITATPSSFIEYMKNSKESCNVKTFYIKAHENYLSFKDIHEQNRFKEGFKFDKKQKGTISKFVIDILCANFLKGKPGSFITRLGVGKGNSAEKGTFSEINNQIKLYKESPRLLELDLKTYQKGVLTQNDIATIVNNLPKLNCLLFSSNGSEPSYTIETRNLDNQNDKILEKNQGKINEFNIASMNNFLNQNTDSYQALFIMNSFLQGKTIEGLNNLRGWFDRYSEDPFSNNAFTIQSVGRNCGPHKNKKYSYPIWVNMQEIMHIITFYEEIEESVMSNYQIDPDTWSDPGFRTRAFITNTYIKIKSDRALAKQYNHVHYNAFHSYTYDADIFASKTDAVDFIKNKLKAINVDLEDVCIKVRNAQLKAQANNKDIEAKNITSYDIYNFSDFITSVSRNTSKNTIHEIIIKSYGRYSKTTSPSDKKYTFGLIYIDNPDTSNQTHIDSWNTLINDDPTSILYQKQGHYVAYINKLDSNLIANSLKNSGISKIKDTKSHHARALKNEA